ncbi:MAG: hypothetical protein ACPG81_06015 [Poseidonia sp.]
MAEEHMSEDSKALIATLEREHEGSVIKFDEQGHPVGIEEQTPQGEALTLGLAFTLFGSIFFFFPLAMMLMFLQDAYLEEMLCIVPFFGIFLLVGGITLAGGLRTLFSGITGKGLTYVVTLDELAERKEEELIHGSTAFSYTSTEELLSQIHRTKTSEPAPSTASNEVEDQPAGGFWDIEHGESSDD